MNSNTQQPGQRRSFAKLSEKKKNKEQLIAAKNQEWAHSQKQKMYAITSAKTTSNSFTDVNLMAN